MMSRSKLPQVAPNFKSCMLQIANAARKRLATAKVAEQRLAEANHQYGYN